LILIFIMVMKPAVDHPHHHPWLSGKRGQKRKDKDQEKEFGLSRAARNLLNKHEQGGDRRKKAWNEEWRQDPRKEVPISLFPGEEPSEVTEEDYVTPKKNRSLERQFREERAKQMNRLDTGYYMEHSRSSKDDSGVDSVSDESEREAAFPKGTSILEHHPTENDEIKHQQHFNEVSELDTETRSDLMLPQNDDVQDAPTHSTRMPKGGKMTKNGMRKKSRHGIDSAQHDYEVEQERLFSQGKEVYIQPYDPAEHQIKPLTKKTIPKTSWKRTMEEVRAGTFNPSALQERLKVRAEILGEKIPEFNVDNTLPKKDMEFFEKLSRQRHASVPDDELPDIINRIDRMLENRRLFLPKDGFREDNFDFEIPGANSFCRTKFKSPWRIA